MKLSDIYRQKREHREQNAMTVVMGVTLGSCVYSLSEEWRWPVFWGAIFLYALFVKIAWSVTGDVRTLIYYIDRRSGVHMLDKEDQK